MFLSFFQNKTVQWILCMVTGFVVFVFCYVGTWLVLFGLCFLLGVEWSDKITLGPIGVVRVKTFVLSLMLIFSVAAASYSVAHFSPANGEKVAKRIFFIVVILSLCVIAFLALDHGLNFFGEAPPANEAAAIRKNTQLLHGILVSLSPIAGSYSGLLFIRRKMRRSNETETLDSALK